MNCSPWTVQELSIFIMATQRLYTETWSPRISYLELNILRRCLILASRGLLKMRRTLRSQPLSRAQRVTWIQSKRGSLTCHLSIMYLLSLSLRKEIWSTKLTTLFTLSWCGHCLILFVQCQTLRCSAQSLQVTNVTILFIRICCSCPSASSRGSWVLTRRFFCVAYQVLHYAATDREKWRF